MCVCGLVWCVSRVVDGDGAAVVGPQPSARGRASSAWRQRAGQVARQRAARLREAVRDAARDWLALVEHSIGTDVEHCMRQAKVGSRERGREGGRAEWWRLPAVLKQATGAATAVEQESEALPANTAHPPGQQPSSRRSHSRQTRRSTGSDGEQGQRAGCGRRGSRVATQRRRDAVTSDCSAQPIMPAHLSSGARSRLEEHRGQAATPLLHLHSAALACVGMRGEVSVW